MIRFDTVKYRQGPPQRQLQLRRRKVKQLLMTPRKAKSKKPSDFSGIQDPEIKGVTKWV